MMMYDYISDLICRGENLTMEQILEETRKEEIVYARQLIMYFSKKMKLGTLAWVSAKLGLDHSTASHAIKTINNYIDTDKVKAEQIKNYAKSIEDLKKLHLLKIEMEKIIGPLQDEMSKLEQRLINVQLSIKIIIDEINNTKI